MLTGAGESPTYPIIRKIGFADLKDAAAKGIADFWVMPTHVIFVAIIYPIVGLFLARMTFGTSFSSPSSIPSLACFWPA